jgi:hypothetical protein
MSTITRSREGAPPPQEQPEAATRRRPHLVPEVVLVVALYFAYSLGRYAAAKHSDSAFHHAKEVWRLERWVGLPNEATLQHHFLQWPRVIDLINLHYQIGYIVSLVSVLVWLYARHPGHYIWYRRFLTLVTGLGLIGHLVFPMAPPRLLQGDRVMDTAQIFGHAVYGPVGTGLANQFAAMPSLHVGWAVVVAVGVIVVLRSPWRWLVVLHPVITLLVVVVSGNHFWTDGIVATVLVAISYVIARAWLPEEPSPFAP